MFPHAARGSRHRTGRAPAIVLLCVAIAGFHMFASARGAGERGESERTGFVEKSVAVEGEVHRYVVYVPPDYDPARRWPLIVFLHGAGDRGRDGKAPTKNGIGPAIRRHPERFPALVLFPQCPKDVFWNAVLDALEEELALTRREYCVEDQRIYLTGISMGGFGTWLWGAMEAGTFAALVPVCGGGSDIPARAKLGMRGPSPFGSFAERVERWVDMPIWAFHGADDKVVPPAQSSRTVALIKKAGGTRVKYTEFPDTGHGCWDKVYGDPEVIAWLLSQRKGAQEAPAMGAGSGAEDGGGCAAASP